MARKKQSEQAEQQDQGVAVADPAAVRAVSLELETIGIGLIVPPLANPRIANAENHEEFEALKASMRDHGLLEPVGVVRLAGLEPCKYRLVWGSRRLRAADELKWSSIQAMVFEEGGIDEERAAAEENLHRRAMNPLEELLAVEALMERQPADMQLAEKQRRVAALLGRSPTWVRDRLFLARLGPEARKAVLDGVLPLAHARELAKVADPRTQEDLLDEWCDDGECHTGIEYARDDVSRCAFSLHQVPWSLDAEGVAKGCRACSGCESNTETAAQQGLFEHDPEDQKLGRLHQADPLGREFTYSERPKGPFCLNESCFAAKAKAAAEAQAKVAKAAAKEKKPADRAEAAIKAAPTWMDPKLVKDAAAAKAPEKPGAAAPKPRKQRSHAEEQRAWKEADARRRKREAESARREAARTDWLAERPGALAMTWIIGHCHSGIFTKVLGPCDRVRGKAAAKALPGPHLHAVLAAIRDNKLSIEDLDKLVREEFKCNAGRNAFTRFLERFGKASREVVDTMLAPPEAAAPADGAAGKPERKTKGGRKAKAAA